MDPGARVAADSGTAMSKWLLAVWFAVGSATAGIEGGERHVGHPDWMDPGIVDIESDLEAASKDGRFGVFVLFTTQGCSYCAEFIRASLGDPQLQQRVRRHFVPIHLEIFDDALMTDHEGNELPIKHFAEQHRAEMAPTLLFFRPQDGLVFRAIGYQSPDRFAHMLDFLLQGQFEQIRFSDYLRQHKAVASIDRSAPMRTDPLFEEPPHALARSDALAAQQPLLVLFERPGCAACEEFHEGVLAGPEIRTLLQGFEVVRLDATDDASRLVQPDGQITTPAAWFNDLGFSRTPALLYFNETGQAVFSTDAVVERQRMLNATGLVLDRAYERGWSYQRYARTKAIERNLQAR